MPVTMSVASSILVTLAAGVGLFAPPSEPAVQGSQDAPGQGARLRGGAREPSPREAYRKLWGRSVVVGGSFGLAAPLGLVGVFAEINPTRHLGLAWGGGYGGFGAAWAGMVRGRALIVDDSAFTAGIGYSVNFTPERLGDNQEALLPPASKWLNLELGREWRFLGGRTLRVALGHAFLLNSGSFGCAPGSACAAADDSTIPGWRPYGGGLVNPGQAAIATSLGQGVHMWFVHVDFGAVFGLLPARLSRRSSGTPLRPARCPRALRRSG
jgi:hypothetical protein